MRLISYFRALDDATQFPRHDRIHRHLRNKQKSNTSDLYTLKLKLLGQINVVRCNRIIYNLLICSIYIHLFPDHCVVLIVGVVGVPQLT